MGIIITYSTALGSGSNWERVDAPGRQVLYPINDKGTNVVIGDDNDNINGIAFRFKAVMGRSAIGLVDNGVLAVASLVFQKNANELFAISAGDGGSGSASLSYSNNLNNNVNIISVNDSQILIGCVTDNGGAAQEDIQVTHTTILYQIEAKQLQPIFGGVRVQITSNSFSVKSSSGGGDYLRVEKSGQINASYGYFDDDAAAGAAGLVAGDMYQTTGAGAAPLNVAGIVMVKQ